MEIKRITSPNRYYKEIINIYSNWWGETKKLSHKEINDLYNQAVEVLKNEGFYGLKNPREFISEALTNLNFQKRLA